MFIIIVVFVVVIADSPLAILGFSATPSVARRPKAGSDSPLYHGIQLTAV
jgi:hypothetical protein